tara:strand:+ start:19166 stop:19774 length:609 start_codon:yes stop_codon:yes gene_type:complete
MVIEEVNKIIKGPHRLPILLDVFYNDTVAHAPLIIFCHGYKGFKDWGAWNLLAKTFADSGIAFLKFNFSHNGGSVEQPIDFPDLEAFGHNNYTKELDDLSQVLDWVETTYSEHPYIDASRLTIQAAAKNLKLPHLIIHGDTDTSVDLKEAFALHKWHPESQLILLEGANHVFGSHHPWDFSELPPYLQQIHSKISHFINNLQ